MADAVLSVVKTDPQKIGVNTLFISILQHQIGKNYEVYRLLKTQTEKLWRRKTIQRNIGEKIMDSSEGYLPLQKWEKSEMI